MKKVIIEVITSLIKQDDNKPWIMRMYSAEREALTSFLHSISKSSDETSFSDAELYKMFKCFLVLSTQNLGALRKCISDSSQTYLMNAMQTFINFQKYFKPTTNEDQKFSNAKYLVWLFKNNNIACVVDDMLAKHKNRFFIPNEFLQYSQYSPETPLSAENDIALLAKKYNKKLSPELYLSYIKLFISLQELYPCYVKTSETRIIILLMISLIEKIEKNHLGENWKSEGYIKLLQLLAKSKRFLFFGTYLTRTDITPEECVKILDALALRWKNFTDTTPLLDLQQEAAKFLKEELQKKFGKDEWIFFSDERQKYWIFKNTNSNAPVSEIRYESHNNHLLHFKEKYTGDFFDAFDDAGIITDEIDTSNNFIINRDRTKDTLAKGYVRLHSVCQLENINSFLLPLPSFIELYLYRVGNFRTSKNHQQSISEYFKAKGLPPERIELMITLEQKKTFEYLTQLWKSSEKIEPIRIQHYKIHEMNQRFLLTKTKDIGWGKDELSNLHNIRFNFFDPLPEKPLKLDDDMEGKKTELLVPKPQSPSPFFETMTKNPLIETKKQDNNEVQYPIVTDFCNRVNQAEPKTAACILEEMVQNLSPEYQDVLSDILNNKLSSTNKLKL